MVCVVFIEFVVCAGFGCTFSKSSTDVSSDRLFWNRVLIFVWFMLGLLSLQCICKHGWCWCSSLVWEAKIKHQLFLKTSPAAIKRFRLAVLSVTSICRTYVLNCFPDERVEMHMPGYFRNHSFLSVLILYEMRARGIWIIKLNYCPWVFVD